MYKSQLSTKFFSYSLFLIATGEFDVASFPCRSWLADFFEAKARVSFPLFDPFVDGCLVAFARFVKDPFKPMTYAPKKTTFYDVINS